MAVQWLLVCLGLVTLLVVASFLCGQWPIFQGTFIQRIHHFLTFAAFDYLRRFVEFVFGSRVTNALYLTQYYCCDRPNPILQAYVQQLEASRLKLLQLEQELEQTKAQCALMSAGVNAGQLGFPGAANSGIAAFEIEYERWVEEQNKRTNALKTALKSSMSEDDLSNLVTDTFNHYASLFTIKENAAKTDVCYLISGVWKTSTERLFLWIGGFRPSDLLKVLVPQLELLDQQSHDLYNLIQECQRAEDSLSQGMEKLQQTLADAVGRGAVLGEGSYEMHKAIKKLEELARLVFQADYIRKETLHQTLRNLTPRQAAQGLISLGEYFQRLRDLSSAWAMWLCEPVSVLMAYVQQLEASRLKLLQLEQELEQTKAQCALMSAGVNAGQLGFPGAANSGIAAFEIEYERWVEEQNKRTNALKTALKSSMSEDDLSNLVTDTFNHYASLFTIKENAAKTDVCYLISGVWKTSTERLFLWIGGFRPSDLLKVLVPQLELLDQQSHDLYNLIQACQAAEDSLSQGMEKIQQTLADAVGRGAALGEGSYEMHKAIEKLEDLVRLVIQADYVRKETLHQTLRNLTPRQAAQGLISLGEYFQRLRDLSSAWAMRLCEPANTMFLS